MNKGRTVVPIHINITDIITPKTCAIYIAELIKYIAYSKHQIPYPYERLKMFVMKRRDQQKTAEISNSQTDSTTSQRVSFLMEKHYKRVEEAYKILDSTFKCIEQGLMNPVCQPIEEVVLLFGATPISPKDVYRIKIPSLNFGHSESQHLWRKQLANLFRGIIISDEVNANFQKKIGLTNMFIFLKMKRGGCISSQWLLPKDGYRLSNRADEISFSFRSTQSTPCSCSNLEFESLAQNVSALSISDSSLVTEGLSDSVWYQTCKTLKGFKDCKLEGKSISDLWYKHRFL